MPCAHSRTCGRLGGWGTQSGMTGRVTKRAPVVQSVRMRGEGALDHLLVSAAAPSVRAVSWPKARKNDSASMGIR